MQPQPKPEPTLREKLFGQPVPLRQKISELRERGNVSKVSTEYSKPIAKQDGTNTEISKVT